MSAKAVERENGRPYLPLIANYGGFRGEDENWKVFRLSAKRIQLQVSSRNASIGMRAFVMQNLFLVILVAQTWSQNLMVHLFF